MQFVYIIIHLYSSSSGLPTTAPCTLATPMPELSACYWGLTTKAVDDSSGILTGVEVFPK